MQNNHILPMTCLQYLHYRSLSSYYCISNFIIKRIKRILDSNTRVQGCAELVCCFFLVYIAFSMLCILDTETYVFQCTTFADFVRPVHRKACSLDPHSISDMSNKDKKQGVSLRSIIQSDTLTYVSTGNNQFNSGIKKNSVSIAIVYLYDSSPSGGNGNDGGEAWNEKLMQRVIKNREQYCKRHGYTLINANNLVDKSRPAAWSKLKAVDRYLYHDYVMYMDMDVVIMDLTRSLESFLSVAIATLPPASMASKDKTVTRPRNIDFIVTEDWNGPNTGNWLVKGGDKNSSVSFSSSTDGNRSFPRWFLREAWKQSHLMKTWSVDGKKHPFQYEQRVFHFLLGTPVWKGRGLSRYNGEKSVEEIQSHFLFFKQCSFNSYSMHPFDWRGDRQVSQYAKGDFLIHFAGKKGRKRTTLMEHYLTISEK